MDSKVSLSINLQPPPVTSQMPVIFHYSRQCCRTEGKSLTEVAFFNAKSIYNLTDWPVVCCIIMLSSFSSKHKQKIRLILLCFPCKDKRQRRDSIPGPREITQGNGQKSTLTDLKILITSKAAGTGFTRYQYQHNLYSARQSPQN